MPHWTVPAFRQHALLLASGRVWMLFAACVAPVLFLEAMRLQEFARPGGPDLAATWPVLRYARHIFLFVAPAWALLVWREEPWGSRDYHWSLPVGRTTHDACRVLAGASWLLCGVILCAGTGILLAVRAGQDAFLGVGAPFWINLFTLPLLLYTAGSILPLATRRPLEWSIAVVVAWAATSTFAQLYGPGALLSVLRSLEEGRFGILMALSGGQLVEWLAFVRGQTGTTVVQETYAVADWLGATALWSILFAGGVFLATRRRR